MPESPQDEDAQWLEELAGRSRAPNQDPDFRVASLLGRLIRSRFASAMQEGRAEPASELTRARLLAHARSYRAPRSRWRTPLAVASALAAGIVIAALWMQFSTPREFSAVTGAEVLGAAPDGKAVELLGTQRFLIHTRDLAGTTSQLMAHLLRVHANVHLESSGADRVRIDVDPLPSVDEDLARTAASLGIVIRSGAPLQFTIQSP